jgi:hypothetical protein
LTLLDGSPVPYANQSVVTIMTTEGKAMQDIISNHKMTEKINLLTPSEKQTTIL